MEVTGIPITNYLTRIDNLISVDGNPTRVTEGLLVDIEVAAIIDQDIPPLNVPMTVADPIDCQNLSTVNCVDCGTGVIIGTEVQAIVVAIAPTGRTGSTETLTN